MNKPKIETTATEEVIEKERSYDKINKISSIKTKVKKKSVKQTIQGEEAY